MTRIRMTGMVRLTLSIELDLKQHLVKICETRGISASDFMREKIKDEYKNILRDRKDRGDDRGELERSP